MSEEVLVGKDLLNNLLKIVVCEILVDGQSFLRISTHKLSEFLNGSLQALFLHCVKRIKCGEHQKGHEKLVLLLSDQVELMQKWIDLRKQQQ